MERCNNIFYPDLKEHIRMDKRKEKAQPLIVMEKSKIKTYFREVGEYLSGLKIGDFKCYRAGEN